MRLLAFVILLLAGLVHAAERPRVLVSTDIGGTDPDDFQSLVHMLLYADVLDIEGIVSSPYGPGRREHILQVIDRYEQDYPTLKARSERYPSPNALRAISKQGALESPGAAGFGSPTEGSKWIVECARRRDARPLYVLVWGGMEDLAQALHDAPDILPKLRVYFIGGPNKMWTVDAYDYVERHHPKLWMIENNATYRGWFTGGDQSGDLGNTSFVTAHIAGRGALGDYFATHLRGTIKMGDTPSVAWLLNRDWGGKFVRTWDEGRRTVFERHTTQADQAQVFGVVEWELPLPAGFTPQNTARLWIDNRIPAIGTRTNNNTMRFRFSPRDAKVWPYVLQSDFAAWNGQSGSFTATPLPQNAKPSTTHPNWWTDDPDPAAAEGVHPGAKHVNRWRADFLASFAERMRRLENRPRVIVLTDIENEPDDTQSMIRFLVYANQFDIEGLVATTSVHQRDRTASARIRELVDAYAKVQPTLSQHEPGYPSAGQLHSLIRDGRPAFGMNAVGKGMDSPGSDRIIEVVDRADDGRPVWVLVWGGPNCLAQALWKVRATRSPKAVERFAAKLRVYAISDQDDSGPWIRKTFPGLFYIVSPGYHAAGAYHHSTWSGISGDHFHGRFAGAKFDIVDNPWLDRNVRAKGPLGALYPQTKFLMEGDTPSFLYLISNGLGDREHPDWGSWGGRYEGYTPRVRKWLIEPETRPIWSDTEDEVKGIDGMWHSSNKATIWRWREAYQNDFAARMDWTVEPFAQANHPPVARLAHADRLQVKSGQQVRLSAAGSSDPDTEDTLRYEWIYYPEPSTIPVSNARTPLAIAIEGNTSRDASFTAPAVTGEPKVMHIILAVTDSGSPALTRYRRVLVTIAP